MITNAYTDNASNQLTDGNLMIRRIPMQNSIPESPRAHILLVERNRGALAFLETMLCWKGYQVTIAADGLDGLEKFRLGQFNLIFTNLSTRRISGWELHFRMMDVSSPPE